MTEPCRFVSLAVAAVAVPASKNGSFQANYHLAAIAMLIAERDPANAWSFSIQSRAIPAGDSEDTLLEWATNVLPTSGIVLGWQLAETIMPPLIDAATTCDPRVGCKFIERLTNLLSAPSADLAVRHGGAAAPDLGVIAASRGIHAPGMSAGELETLWAFGDVAGLQAHVERQAIAIWRLWLAEASDASAACAAFADWLAL